MLLKHGLAGLGYKAAGGGPTEIFSDDFSSYTTGIDLDTEAAYTPYAAFSGGLRDLVVSATDTVYCDDITFKSQSLRRETDLTSVDHYVEADGTFATSSTANTRLGLFAGQDASGTKAYVVVFYGNGNIELFVDVEGGTSLGTGTFTPTEGSSQVFRIDRDETASTVVVKVDGTTQITASSETTNTGGQYGGFGQFEGVALAQSFFSELRGGTL
jgi:hypothetical protein